MDGSGVLLDDFCTTLKSSDPTREVVLIEYPQDEYLDYDTLATRLKNDWIPEKLPSDNRGYVLVSQSYSAHVGLRIRAATGRLLAHVFINAFAGRPLTLPRVAWRLFPRILFRIPPPSRIAAPIFLGNSQHDAMRKVQLKAAECSAEVMSHRLRDCLAEDSWHRWRDGVALPGRSTLYLCGAADPLVGGTNMARLMRDARDDISWVKIDNGPHLLLQRFGNRCAKTIDEFLANIENDV